MHYSHNAGLDLQDILAEPLILGNGASGYKGVTKTNGRWQAGIVSEKDDRVRDNIPQHLGLFDSPEEAV